MRKATIQLLANLQPIQTVSNKVQQLVGCGFFVFLSKAEFHEGGCVVGKIEIAPK
jgi:hypothetical protein